MKVMRVKLYNSKAWMYRRYVIEKKSVDEIAKAASTSRRTIYLKLKEYGFLRNNDPLN